MDDFELDPEVLKQIEEEARRKVEEDFELDEATLKQIEQDALKEAGLLDDELGEMTMAGISAETVKEMRKEKESAPPAPAPPAPTPEAAKAPEPAVAPPPVPPPAEKPAEAKAPAAAPEAKAADAKPEAADAKPEAADAKPADAKADDKKPEAKDADAAPGADEGKSKKSLQDAQKKAYEKARGEALNKAKKKMADKAKVVAAKRKGMPTASPTLTAIENEPKGGTAIILFIAASVVTLFLLIGGIAIWKMNKPAPVAAPGTGPDGAPVVTKSQLQLGQERFRELRKEITAIEKSPSAPKIEAILADIAEFRSTYPEAAASGSKYLDGREKKLNEILLLYSGDGSGAETPVEDPVEDVAP